VRLLCGEFVVRYFSLSIVYCALVTMLLQEWVSLWLHSIILLSLVNIDINLNVYCNFIVNLDHSL
jgi:hypothetical protein